MPFMQNSEIQKFWSAIRFSSLLKRFNNDKTAYKFTDKQWIFKNPWQVVIMFLTFQLVILLNFFSALCTLEHYSVYIQKLLGTVSYFQLPSKDYKHFSDMNLLNS